MTKQKQVTLKMDVRTAAAVRQLLFDAQKNYSYEHTPERIVDIRSVILNIDEGIEAIIGNEVE